jgi:hypothetical protein
MVWWILVSIFALVLVIIIGAGVMDKDWEYAGVFFGILVVGSIALGVATLVLMALGSGLASERHFTYSERYKIVENSPIENDSDLEIFVYDENGVIDEMDIYASKITVSGKNHVIIDHYIEDTSWAVPWVYSFDTEVKIID